MTISLRETKAFKKLFPFRRGDYIRYRQQVQGKKTSWKYGTIEIVKSELNYLYVRKSTNGMVFLLIKRGDEVQLANRRIRNG